MVPGTLYWTDMPNKQIFENSKKENSVNYLEENYESRYGGLTIFKLPGIYISGA